MTPFAAYAAQNVRGSAVINAQLNGYPSATHIKLGASAALIPGAQAWAAAVGDRATLELLGTYKDESLLIDTLKFSGLALDTAAGFRAGGLHGPVVTAGDPQASRLYRKVARLEKPVMPMQGDPLTGDESALVKRWIEMGAPWPEDAAAQNAEKAKQDRVAALKKLEDRRVITEKDREFQFSRALEEELRKHGA